MIKFQIKYFKILIIFYMLFAFYSCKTLKVIDTATQGKVLYKNLILQSKNLDFISINGLYKISGIKDYPNLFLKFESQCKFKENFVKFSISSFKSKLFDIFLIENNIIFINHTANEFVKLSLKEIDLSKLTGINFNPMDINYFFLGLIPHSDSMELLNFKLTNKEYILDISDAVSKYTIYLTHDEKLKKIEVFNQYFDNFIIDSIRYSKDNDEQEERLKLLTLITKDNNIKISFVINSVSDKEINDDIFDLNILKEYTEISSIEKLHIDIKKQ